MPRTLDVINGEAKPVRRRKHRKQKADSRCDYGLAAKYTGWPEDDGQPDEAQEWHDYDPDC